MRVVRDRAVVGRERKVAQRRGTILVSVVVALDVVCFGAALSGCVSEHVPLDAPAARYESDDGQSWLSVTRDGSISDAQLPLFPVGVDNTDACDRGETAPLRRFSAHWVLLGGYRLSIDVPNALVGNKELLLRGEDDWSTITYYPCGPDRQGIVLKPVDVASA